jgi:hypothetical protein
VDVAPVVVLAVAVPVWLETATAGPALRKMALNIAASNV